MKNITWILALAFAFCLAGCSDDDKTGYVTSIEILDREPQGLILKFRQPTEEEPEPDNTYQVNVSTVPPGSEVKFVGNNAEVFTVSNTGLITMLKYGMGELVVTARGSADSYTQVKCPVWIYDDTQSISVTGGSEYYVQSGETLDISGFFSALPAATAIRAFNYSVGSESVVSVTPDGIVTGLSTGETTVSAIAIDNAQIVSDPITIKVVSKYEDLDKAGWTASASSTYSTTYVTYRPSFTIDNLGSYWRSSQRMSDNSDQWVIVDMKSVQNFNLFTFHRSTLRSTRKVELYGSTSSAASIGADDASFSKIGELQFTSSSASVPDSVNLFLYPDDKASARYLKMQFTECFLTSGYPECKEIDLRNIQ